MNRRYVIAAAAVVAVAGGWYMFGQGGGGGGSSSSATSGTAASGSGPQLSGATGGGGGDASQLYGYATATVVTGPTGSLGSLSTFGRPRDVFVQIAGASGSAGSSMTFGSTPTTKIAPVSLGSGVASAVASGTSGGSGATTPATPVTQPTTTTPAQTLAAEFDINGEPIVAYDGDQIPPETQQFTVKSMTTRQVVLVLNGALLANGASSVVIKVGQTITLSDQTAHTTTVIHLISVHPA